MDLGNVTAPYLPLAPCQQSRQKVHGNDSDPTLATPFLSSGERYIGMWQADQRHGPGVLVTQAGVCYQGTFQADKIVVSGVTYVCPELSSPSPGAEFCSPHLGSLKLRRVRGGWDGKLGS